MIIIRVHNLLKIGSTILQNSPSHYTQIEDGIASIHTVSFAYAIIVFDIHVTVHRDKFLKIKPTSCTNFSNLFLE